jgi:hypothetical protein
LSCSFLFLAGKFLGGALALLLVGALLLRGSLALRDALLPAGALLVLPGGALSLLAGAFLGGGALALALGGAFLGGAFLGGAFLLGPFFFQAGAFLGGALLLRRVLALTCDDELWICCVAWFCGAIRLPGASRRRAAVADIRTSNGSRCRNARQRCRVELRILIRGVD